MLVKVPKYFLTEEQIFDILNYILVEYIQINDLNLEVIENSSDRKRRPLLVKSITEMLGLKDGRVNSRYKFLLNLREEIHLNVRTLAKTLVVFGLLQEGLTLEEIRLSYGSDIITKANWPDYFSDFFINLAKKNGIILDVKGNVVGKIIRNDLKIKEP